MTRPTALQFLMGYDPATGEYHKANMLVRLAQMGVMADRDISQAEIARRLKCSPEGLSNYFRGDSYMVALHKQNWTEPEEKRNARVRTREDEVERAIEDVIRERGATVPQVIGTDEETYISDLITERLMSHG